MSYSDGLFCIEDVVRLRETPGNVKAVVKQTAALDGHDVEIHIEQEPGSSGLAVIADYVRSLPAYVVKASPASGSKESRAAPFAAQAEAKNVVMVEAVWNENYLQELEQFPSTTVKNDQVDASAGAYNVISAQVEAGDMSDMWAGGERSRYLE
jgi:predicted phage terminase large subunit-like protein